MNPSFAAATGSTIELNQHAAGVILSPQEFDSAGADPYWRYELINGVVIVNPAPSPKERGSNEMLGHWLLSYKENHPSGSSIDCTLHEHDVHIGDNRRRADRVIWTGLGRQPRIDETPAIVVEFVSAGKRNFTRDYEIKRTEYASINVPEYWVFNRFERTMAIFKSDGSTQVVSESDTYSTPLLPGFEVTPRKLFEIADAWD
ncbi:MAG: Uma2 family endonuclease [Planctomycetales bacterium]|nr:Uma2 family endonuclease [Planctomycetales bacterium]